MMMCSQVVIATRFGRAGQLRGGELSTFEEGVGFRVVLLGNWMAMGLNQTDSVNKIGLSNAGYC